MPQILLPTVCWWSAYQWTLTSVVWSLYAAVAIVGAKWFIQKHRALSAHSPFCFWEEKKKVTLPWHPIERLLFADELHYAGIICTSVIFILLPEAAKWCMYQYQGWVERWSNRQKFTEFTADYKAFVEFCSCWKLLLRRENNERITNLTLEQKNFDCDDKMNFKIWSSEKKENTVKRRAKNFDVVPHLFFNICRAYIDGFLWSDHNFLLNDTKNVVIMSHKGSHMGRCLCTP